MKNIRIFLSENFQFLEVKFSLYLNRCFRNGLELPRSLHPRVEKAWIHREDTSLIAVSSDYAAHLPEINDRCYA